jgi:methionyl-tRNA formyltransferase
VRLIIHGQQAFGKAVLEGLLDRNEEIVGVYCAPDVSARRLDPLKELAINVGLPILQPASYNEGDVQREMADFSADLCVMAYVTLMVPEAVLNTPRLGSIQYHPSLLPMHRGPSSINWPIIFGEKRTGLSIFWPDHDIDTGPILLQKECSIGPDDTLGSLYFNHLFPMGVAAMLEAVDLVREGKAPKIPQLKEKGSYEGWCRREESYIDWSRSADDVYNLIRGCDPQPGAWTVFDGIEIQLFDCRMGKAVSATPGTILDAADQLIIATGKGSIKFKKIRPKGEQKMDVEKFISDYNVKKGMRISF